MQPRYFWLAALSICCAFPVGARQCPKDFQGLRSESDNHVRSGRLADAEELLRGCRQQWAAALPPNDPNMLGSAAYLGQVLALQGKMREAEPLLQDAYRKANATQDSPSIGVVAASLGSLYRYQHDTARALPLLRVAHRRFVDLRGPKDTSVGLVLAEIAAIHAEDRAFRTAESQFFEARAILSANGMDEEVLTCDVYIAALQIEQGRLAEAEARLKSAQQTSPRDQSILAGSARALADYHLARIYRLQGKRDAADAQYQVAIAAYEASVVQPSPQLPSVVDEYASFLKKVKAPTAKGWAARAKALRALR